MNSPSYWEKSATDIANLVKTRNVTAEAVAQSALARMAETNPVINAVVQSCRDEALQDARKLDQEIARGESVGPLAGVPVTVKVNIDQQGYPNTNGLVRQQDLIATRNHPVVDNLKAAGAIIIGRTNTPAFSARWFTRNRLHGATTNPVNPTLTPGGSSGGAAAAVASGIGALAHGTDIAGSIRYPAYACGVHGLRPTLGRVPAWNASSADRFLAGQLMVVSGPLARCIDDIELGLLAMATESALDPWWMPVPYQQTPLDKKVALSLPTDWPVDEQVAAIVREAGNVLARQGWAVEEVAAPDLNCACELNLNLWMADMQKAGLHLVEEEGDTDAQFAIGEMIKRCRSTLDSTFLQTAIQARLALIREWQLFLERYPIVLCPVSAEPPFEDHRDVRSVEDFDAVFRAQRLQIALPLLGLPALTVSKPASDQIPLGVQLVGPRFREDHLLLAGRDLEAIWGQIPPVSPTA